MNNISDSGWLVIGMIVMLSLQLTMFITNSAVMIQLMMSREKTEKKKDHWS